MDSAKTTARHGAKADNLKRLQRLGIKVPKFVTVGDSDYAKFHEKVRGLKYPLILRSSSSLEDQKESSFAGVFHSVRVTDKKHLDDCFKKVKSLNEKSLRQIARQNNLGVGDIRLDYVVQEFKPSVRGGVMKVPKSKQGDVIIETGETPDAVTDGSQTPRTIVMKFADHTDREPWELDLLKIAKHISDHFDTDQDVEWLQTEKDELYVVQTRPFVPPPIETDHVLAAERKRLSKYPLHAGAYETEYLPDIAAPTPLTLELISALYSRGLVEQGVVRKGAQPLVIIAGDIYLDKKAYRKSIPLLRQLSNSLQLLRAYRLFRTNVIDYSDKQPHDSLDEIKAYMYEQLTPKIFRNTREIQIVQSILGKKLDIPVTHDAFNEPHERPLRREWYAADNEYELSALRHGGLRVDSEDLMKFEGVEPDRNQIARTREDLTSSLISAFDVAYCANLFKLYDFLCHQRAVLHDKLIESIATIHQLLRETDTEKKLRNLIWYATFDEISSDTIPPADELRRRKDAWQTLQSLPLPHPNQLQSWDDLTVVRPDQNSTSLHGISLCPGVARGIIGKDIVVTRALTQGLLLDPGVKGIITERGGALSHIAILARERHVPIIRVDNATLRCKPGVSVIIDADNGTVSQ